MIGKDKLRLIHLILAIPLIFITYKTHLVVGFFNDYVSNGYTFQTGTDAYFANSSTSDCLNPRNSIPS